MAASRITKRLSAVITSVLILLMAGICFILLSCSPRQSAVQMEAEGALLIPSQEKETRLRAYCPEIALTLTWQEGERGSAAVVVENIAAESAEVKVTPAAGQQEASCTVEQVSPTVLRLKVKGSGTQRLELKPASADKGMPFQFAVVGDCQGRIDVLSKIIEEVNKSDADFLICVGDLVASGSDEEYKAFQEAMQKLNCPYYTIPGNHDVKGNGIDYYRKYLGPEYYSFVYRGSRFFLLNSSSMGMDAEQLAWLQEKLKEGEQPAYIFLHVPPVDPRGGDHAFLDSDQAQAFIKLVAAPTSPVKGIFTGHIHMFYQGQIEGVDFVISGGGGASLYASADQGGYYHFALCRVATDGLQVEPEKIEAPARSDELVVNGKKGDVILSQSELDKMAVLEGELAFENQFGNFKGKGVYRAVPIRDLVEKVGGMEPGDTLMVYALDGYSQIFAYENVYPESCGWTERQGEIALAIEYNDTTVPEWNDGYRIAFFPEDGVYDNEDCSLTSAPGQGWHLYQSAGARWVRNVIRLEVVPCQDQD